MQVVMQVVMQPHPKLAPLSSFKLILAQKIPDNNINCLQFSPTLTCFSQSLNTKSDFKIVSTTFLIVVESDDIGRNWYNQH
jgi:hypothetical protein